MPKPKIIDVAVNEPKQAIPEIPKQVEALVTIAPEILAKVCVVENGDGMAVAMGELAQIKKNLAVFKPARKEFLAPAMEMLKKYEVMFDERADPVIKQLGQAKTQWDAEILQYRARETERARREKEARDQEVAEEQQRLNTKAAAERARASIAAKRAMAEAQQLADAGHVEEAALAMQEAEEVQMQSATNIMNLSVESATLSAAPVEVDIPKTGAGHFTKTWSGECVDFEELVLAVADGIRNNTRHPSIAHLKLDQVVLNGSARSLKDHFNIPGCKAVSKDSITSRR